jgi:hypothetical protein
MSVSKKKKTKKAAASSKIPSKKDIPKPVKLAFTSGAKAATFFLATDQCPTRPYDGAVRLNDDALQSFLQTPAGTYLMLVDSDCSGQGSRQKVINAYNVFSNNPGRNQRLVCQGFLHEYGTTQVLHVVQVVR